MWTATHRARARADGVGGSKRDILHFFDVPGRKIDVIYNAIDERFWQPPTAEDMQRVRERYQLDRAFVLYAGNIKPHKNLERLIEAFHLLRQSAALEHLKLLIIGDEISKYAALRRAVHRYQLHKYVRFLGFVPDETLAVLYRLAGVFVFPSLYEGFGLPPLEAMASGTPVVTSNVSSLPEVVGDAAVLVDPYEPEAIADGIRRVSCTDDAICARRSVHAGLARAREFSWERSVRARPRDLRRGAAGRRARVTATWTVAGRARPRLADRHARRREGARGALPSCFPERRALHAGARRGLGLPAHRAAPDPHVVRPAAAARRAALPPVPAALPDRDRAVRSRRFDLVVSTSHCAAKSVVVAGRARTSATATRRCATLGPVRRLFRAGAAGPGPAAPRCGRCWPAGAVGPRHGRPRGPLCR